MSSWFNRSRNNDVQSDDNEESLTQRNAALRNHLHIARNDSDRLTQENRRLQNELESLTRTQQAQQDRMESLEKEREMNQKMMIVTYTRIVNIFNGNYSCKAMLQKIIDELNAQKDRIAKEREISSSPDKKQVTVAALMEAENQRMKEEITGLHRKLRSSEEVRKQQLDQMFAISTERDSIQQQYQQLNSEKDELIAERDQLAAAKEELATLSRKQQKEVAVLRGLQTLRVEMEVVEGQNERLRTEIESTRLENEEIRERMQVMEAEKERAKQEHCDSRSKLQRDTDQQIAAMRDDLQRKESKLNSLREQMVSEVTERSTIQQQYRQLNSEKDELTAERDRLIAAKEELAALVRQQQNTVAFLTEEKDTEEQLRRELEEGKEELSAECQRQRQMVETMTKQMETIRSEKQKTEKRCESIMAEKENLERELRDKDQQIGSLREEKDRLFAENLSLTEQLSMKRAHGKQRKLEILELREEVKRLKLLQLNESKYIEWGPDEIATWIINLDANRLRKYEEALSKGLIENDANGALLAEVDGGDLKDWGIIDRKDRKYVMAAIERLVANDALQAPQNVMFEGAHVVPTAYV